jgi:hypothetical protein
MNSSINEFLDEVDQWKFKVHDQLKALTPKQRAAFWARFGAQARRMGLRVVQADKPPLPRGRRTRRTGPAIPQAGALVGARKTTQ